MNLLDANGKPLNAAEMTPPVKHDPAKEISKIIRMIETAKRTDVAELCAVLEAVRQAGWGLTIDPSLQTMRVEVTLITHLRRDVNGDLKKAAERWVRMGNEYEGALTFLKEKIDWPDENSDLLDKAKKELIN